MDYYNYLMLSLGINFILFFFYLSPHIVYLIHRDKFNWKTESSKKEKKVINRYRHCDILLTPGGLYVPIYKGQYPFITVPGTPDLHSTICNFNSFKTKSDAKWYLDRWLDLKMIETKSVGI